MNFIALSISGSHRTGKTTLAEKLALKLKIPFAQTNVSGTFARLGFDPQMAYPLEQRLLIQNAILDDFEVQIDQIRETQLSLSGRGEVAGYITDRSPVDFLGYMLADVLREPQSSTIQKQLAAYQDRCINLLNHCYSHVILVQPGIKWADAKLKGPNNPAYGEHINFIMSGVIHDERLHSREIMIPRHCLDLDARINFITESL